MPELPGDREQDRAGCGDHDPHEEDPGVAVQVAEAGHQQYQAAQHQQVDDDDPGGIVDGRLEVLGESRQRQRDRQAGELHHHVCGREGQKHFTSLACGQQWPEDA